METFSIKFQMQRLRKQKYIIEQIWLSILPEYQF